MNLPEVMADLRASRRFPTDEEAALIARDGTALEVAEALNYSCATNPVLRKRYSADRRKGP